MDTRHITASQREGIAQWDRLAEHGWTLYLVVFALLAVVLIVAVLLPSGTFSTAARTWTQRLGMHRKSIAIAALLGLMVLCSISHQTALDARRGFIKDRDKRTQALARKLEEISGKDEALQAQYMYMPQGNSLRYMSLGNTALAADYVWLTSLQYVSTSFRRGHKHEMMMRFYDTISDLQPKWVEILTNGGKVLSAIQRDREKIENFYIKAIARNPDSWFLNYEAGMVFTVPPQNFELVPLYAERSIEWYRKALRKKDIPKEMTQVIKGRIARLGMEAGYFEDAAFTAFQTATNPDNPRFLRDASASTWLNAHSQVQVERLTHEVEAYKRAQGNYPPSIGPFIDRLDKAGQWMPRQMDFIPKGHDAFGFPIEYNPATGKVVSKGVGAFKAIQCKAVIDLTIEIFRGERHRAPRDLTDLRDYLRSYYKRPGNSLTIGIVEGIGTDIDPTRCPIGEWNYDSKKGEIILPDFCNKDVIYKNAVIILDKYEKRN